MTLYEIGKEYLDLFEAIQVDPDTGEVLGGEQLAQARGRLEDKCEATACYIKGMEGDLAAIKQEIDRLSKRAKALSKKREAMCQYLGAWVEATGLDKLETPRVVLSWRKTSSVAVDDLAALPPACKRQRVIVEPDKAVIRQLLKLGDVPGARLEESRSLQIR